MRKTSVPRPQRNARFAEALDELRRRGIACNQKELALLVGKSENSISRILRGHVGVSEEVITRLQTATDCLFNLQWLRGESDIKFTADVKAVSGGSSAESPSAIPSSQNGNGPALAAKDEAIAALRREVEAKEETIAALRREAEAKDSLIDELRIHLADLRRHQGYPPSAESGLGMIADASRQGYHTSEPDKV